MRRLLALMALALGSLAAHAAGGGAGAGGAGHQRAINSGLPPGERGPLGAPNNPRPAAKLGRIDASNGVKAQAEAGYANAKAQAQALAQSAHATADSTIGAVVQSLGTPGGTRYSLGSLAQAQGRDWLANAKPELEKAIWEPIESGVPANTPAPLNNFKSALDEITGGGGEASGSKIQGVLDLLGGGLPKAISARLKPQAAEGAGPEVLEGQAPEAVSPADLTTWDDARKLSKVLGERIGQPGVSKDISDEQGRRLYAALQDDRRAALGGMASPAGQPSMVDKFDQASREAEALHDFISGPLSELLPGAKPSASDKPAVALDALTKGLQADPTSIMAIRQYMPNVADTIASHVLQNHPEAWDGLRALPESKAALLPDSINQRLVDASRGAKAQADATLADSLASAKSKAKEAKTEGLQGVSQNISDLGQALKDRTQALNALQPNSPAGASAGLNNILRMVSGVSLGDAAGHMAGTALGVPFGADLGRIIGPGLVRAAGGGGRAALRNPNILRYPVAGAIGGRQDANGGP